MCYLPFSQQSCEMKEFDSHLTEEQTKAQRGHLTGSHSLQDRTWTTLMSVCLVNLALIQIDPPPPSTPSYPPSLLLPPKAQTRGGHSLYSIQLATAQGLGKQRQEGCEHGPGPGKAGHTRHRKMTRGSRKDRDRAERRVKVFVPTLSHRQSTGLC